MTKNQKYELPFSTWTAFIKKYMRHFPMSETVVNIHVTDMSLKNLDTFPVLNSVSCNTNYDSLEK